MLKDFGLAEDKLPSFGIADQFAAGALILKSHSVHVFLFYFGLAEDKLPSQICHL